MSREPTEDDVTLALRLGTQDLKRDIVEAQKDLEHFLNRWSEEVSNAAKEASKIDEANKKIATGDTSVMGEKRTAQRNLDYFKERAKLQERYIKTMEKELVDLKGRFKILRATNAILKDGVMQYDESLQLIKSVTQAEKALQKQVEKRVKKEERAAKAKAKSEAEANKGTIGNLKERMRMYSVLSSNGVRMIGTMRGAAGAAIGAIAVAGQFFAQQIMQGLRHLQEYEGVARRIAFIQAGQGMGTLSAMYGDTYGGLIGGASFTGMSGIWESMGIPRIEGASLEIMRMQSGLEFTDEQLKQISISSKFIGEESSDFFGNLIKWVRLFNIEAEDFDETIAMFAMMSGQTMGGSAALGGQIDYVAGLAQTGGWDPNQILMVQEQIRESGRDTSRFWRGFQGTVETVMGDDSLLVESIYDVNGKLRSLDEILWILDETMDSFNDETEASNWALETFGRNGFEAIMAIRELTDDLHNYSTVVQTAEEYQNNANNAILEAEDVWDNSLERTMNKLNQAIEDFQMALAAVIAGPLTDLLNFGTDILDGTSNIAKAGRTITGQATTVDKLLNWAGTQRGNTVRSESMLAGDTTGSGLDFLWEFTFGAVMGNDRREEWLTLSPRSLWFQQGAEESESDYLKRLLNQYCVENPTDNMCSGFTPSYENVAPGTELPLDADYGGRGTPSCGEGFIWNGYECVPEDIEEPHSPVRRIGVGDLGVGSTINKKTSSSVVNHNYITVMDNDALIRGLLGMNLNV